MKKLQKIKKEKWIVKTLININPEIKTFLKSKNFNLIDNGLIDSLMIIKLLFEIEKINKKRINPSKLKRENFINIENIMKLLK